MKYLVRALKYFLYFVLLLVVILAVLILLGLAESDPSTLFRNGYDSYWQIALMFAALAALYPMFGFMKKDVLAPGEYSEIRSGVIDTMASRGYELEKEEGENLTFRLRSRAARISRMWEDRITLTRGFSGFTMEGLRKDVVRLSYAIESKFRNDEQ